MHLVPIHHESMFGDLGNGEITVSCVSPKWVASHGPGRY